MKMKKRGLFFGFGVLACLLSSAACLVEESPDEVLDETEDPIYSVTMVELQPDGNHIVTTSTIRLSEQIRQREAEAAGAVNDAVGEARDTIAQDPTCAWSSLRIWRLSGFTGHQLCFSGTGVADLNNYQWCTGPFCNNWTGDIGSLVAGDYSFISSWVLYSGEIACCQSCGLRSEEEAGDATVCEADAATRYVGRGGCAPC